MIKFKSGDLIKMLADCSDCIKGKVYPLKNNKGILCAMVSPKITGCSCEKNWKKVETKKEVIKKAIINKKTSMNVKKSKKQRGCVVKKSGKWEAQVGLNGTAHYVGRFKTKKKGYEEINKWLMHHEA